MWLAEQPIRAGPHSDLVRCLLSTRPRASSHHELPTTLASASHAWTTAGSSSCRTPPRARGGIREDETLRRGWGRKMVARVWGVSGGSCWAVESMERDEGRKATLLLRPHPLRRQPWGGYSRRLSANQKAMCAAPNVTAGLSAPRQLTQWTPCAVPFLRLLPFLSHTYTATPGTQVKATPTSSSQVSPAPRLLSPSPSNSPRMWHLPSLQIPHYGSYPPARYTKLFIHTPTPPNILFFGPFFCLLLLPSSSCPLPVYYSLNCLRPLTCFLPRLDSPDLSNSPHSAP